eukprot:COSAG02_NODE_34144_length_489_cov_0.564103_1_plen_24_part_01
MYLDALLHFFYKKEDTKTHTTTSK